jgi:ketosteroid isomerase-like protein
MKIKTEETVIAGDLAYSRGSYEQIATTKADGTSVRLVGKFLDILVRQPDGSWKITRDCYNYDGPPVPVAK